MNFYDVTSHQIIVRLKSVIENFFCRTNEKVKLNVHNALSGLSLFWTMSSSTFVITKYGSVHICYRRHSHPTMYNRA